MTFSLWARSSAPSSPSDLHIRSLKGDELMTVQLPPIPSDIPVLIETSYSGHCGPESHGIDAATQWWCQANRRTTLGDARAEVFAPGGAPDQPLLTLTTAAEDLDETEAVGHYAIRIARGLVQLVDDPDDVEAQSVLKELLSPSGLMRMHSGPSWHKIREWLPDARSASGAADIPELSLEGWGAPEELWTVSMVAKYLGYTGDAANASARKQLARWGVVSQGREAGRRGESQYFADVVRAAREKSPGKGRRGAPRAGGRFTGSDGS